MKSASYRGFALNVEEQPTGMFFVRFADLK